MTTITLSLVAAAPPGESDPTAWTLGYIAGILRAQGVTVRSIVAGPDVEQAVGMDLGPGVRRALDTAVKLAADIDASHAEAIAEVPAELADAVVCAWCDRSFRPRGILIHQARCPNKPVPEVATTSAAAAAPDRARLHDARRARAAEAM